MKEENRDIEEQEEPQEEKKISEKQSNQLKWILGILGFFLVALFFFMWVGGDSQNYEYVGLQWQKEKFGEIPIDTTFVTGYSITGKAINFKMPFRNDPRKLNIPIEGEIEYIEDRPIYFSIDFDSEINDCGTIGLINFGRFMAEMGLDVTTSVTNKSWAEELNKPIATCEDRPENTVLVFTSGEESKIVRDKTNPNCYHLIINKCQDVEVLEKLQVATLAKYTNQKL